MPPRLAKGARGKTGPPIKKEEAAKDPQYLAPKDAALLAQVFQQYEEKKYTASIKSADLILKKYPDHAQTLCMKGLSTYNQGKREEGREIAKRGLSLELTSHVTWHVNALIHRADREYTEALKCYIQANKVEPNDMNVLRDLINLQLFLRHYEGACISRLNLVRLQPRLRYSWTALAVAHHLNGDYARASEILQTYCEMLDSVPAHDYDYSEVVLYRIFVALESKDYAKANEVLEKEGRKIVDLQSKKELSAQIQIGLGRAKAAELAYQELLDDNSDNKSYLASYLETKGIELSSINDSTRSIAVEALQTLSDRYPKSRTIRRAVLEAVQGDLFRKRVNVYIVEGLAKGIPSLFSDLKYLLNDNDKRQIISETALNMRKLMEEGKTIEGDEPELDAEEAPTTYIWLLYLIAQIQLHLQSYDEALGTIEAAMLHTPVLPELWMIKARILKRSGDVVAAEEAMSTARFLDEQDRYLNGKHVKYLLRLDDVKKAEEVAGLFTRKDAESPLQDLTDMQCLWFLSEEGHSYRRQGNLGLALKRYHSIERIFSEMYEDEFDFHGYCMRKFTLRSCINLVRSNNQLRKHPAFLAAARGAIEIYLQLHGKPYEKPVTNGTHDVEADALSEEDRRKAEKKAKKLEAKAKAAAEEAKKILAKGNQKKDEIEEEIIKDVDQDLNGEKLWQTTTPLKDLEPFVAHLELLGQDNVEALELVCRVALKRGELARALKSLNRLHEIAPQSPTLHLQLIEFALLLQTPPSGISEAVLALLRDELQSILPDSSITLESYNTQYLQQHPRDAAAALAVAQAQWTISNHRDKDGVVSLMLEALKGPEQPTLGTVQAALAFLRDEVQADSQVIQAFNASAKAFYPRATILKTSEELAAQKASIEEARRMEKEAGNEASQ